jgi:hypothetical protein
MTKLIRHNHLFITSTTGRKTDHANYRFSIQNMALIMGTMWTFVSAVSYLDGSIHPPTPKESKKGFRP